jgi:hypothetical protein
MPNPAQQRSPKVAQRDGRLVRAPSLDLRRARQALISNPLRPCDWNNCGCSRWKLSRFCRTHELNNYQTGHPIAASVRRGTWGPYIELAAAFINEQLMADHPGIIAAVIWCSGELFPKGAVVTRVAHQRPHRAYQAFLTKSRHNGTEPTDLLAYAITGELADDRDLAARPLFASDSHRRHQGARLYLRAVPPSLNDSFLRRKIERPLATREHKGDRSPNWKTREYTHQRVNEALGLLCLKAAEEIRRRLAITTPPDTQRGPIPGSAAPFINATLTGLAPCPTTRTTRTTTRPQAPPATPF